MVQLLIAMDGTHPAEELLKQVRILPAPSEVDLLLLHCIDLNSIVARSGPLGYDQAIQAKEQHAQSYLDREAAKLGELGYTQVRTHLGLGPARQSILNVAQAENVDLIVLQTHGRSGLQWLFMGSVAEGVIRRSTCPVLVLPACTPDSDPVVDSLML